MKSHTQIGDHTYCGPSRPFRVLWRLSPPRQPSGAADKIDLLDKQTLVVMLKKDIGLTGTEPKRSNRARSAHLQIGMLANADHVDVAVFVDLDTAEAASPDALHPRRPLPFTPRVPPSAISVSGSCTRPITAARVPCAQQHLVELAVVDTRTSGERARHSCATVTCAKPVSSQRDQLIGPAATRALGVTCRHTGQQDRHQFGHRVFVSSGIVPTLPCRACETCAFTSSFESSAPVGDVQLSTTSIFARLSILGSPSDQFEIFEMVLRLAH